MLTCASVRPGQVGVAGRDGIRSVASGAWRARKCRLRRLSKYSGMNRSWTTTPGIRPQHDGRREGMLRIRRGPDRACSRRVAAALAGRRLFKVVDVVADECLPALVRWFALELAKRRGEVVALDEMKQVAAATPDPPVVNAGPPVRLDQLVGNPHVRRVVGFLATRAEDGVQRDDLRHRREPSASTPAPAHFRGGAPLLSARSTGRARSLRGTELRFSASARPTAPPHTLTTAGWASGNARAAAGSVVPCRSQTRATSRAHDELPRGRRSRPRAAALVNLF